MPPCRPDSVALASGGVPFEALARRRMGRAPALVCHGPPFPRRVGVGAGYVPYICSMLETPFVMPRSASLSSSGLSAARIASS